MAGGTSGSDEPRLDWWVYRCDRERGGCGYSWKRPGSVAKPRERCDCGRDVVAEPDEVKHG